MLFVRCGVALILATTALPALAAPPAYLDDRSTAASLVRSFYNAVNRHEYARAYTYFGADNGPTPYPQFAAGYSNTVSVSVVTGAAVGDGAAGSTYFTLPVAIDAVSTDGSHKQFAGCYTTRLIEPGVQEPPVTPMFISKAKLSPAHGSIRALLPQCAP
jgi:hypothetical protein